jgi:hypothetical protein
VKFKSAVFGGVVLALAWVSAGCGPDGAAGIDARNSPAAASGANESTNQIFLYGIDSKSGNAISLGVPIGLRGGTATSILASADGRFIYVTYQNSVDLSTVSPNLLTFSDLVGRVATFAVDAHTGQLDLQGAPVPTAPYTTQSASGDFNPTGPAAATILPYSIDPSTGALTAVGSGTSVATNGGPIVIDPSGHYLYALNSSNAGSIQDTIQAFSMNQSTGALSSMGRIIQTDGPRAAGAS